ncbi:RatA -like protein [Salmonella bongori]|nr:RatA -like protein [Salmonella bongori]
MPFIPVRVRSSGKATSSAFLVSCVDKALPAAHPQISLSPAGPYKAQVGESIDLVMTVVDRDTKKTTALSLYGAVCRSGD